MSDPSHHQTWAQAMCSDSSPTGIEPYDLARWLLTARRIIVRANDRWIQVCRDRGLAPPGGEVLVTRSEFHLGVYLRAFPSGPYVGLNSAIRALASLHATDPDRVRTAVRKYLGDLVETRTGGNI